MTKNIRTLFTEPNADGSRTALIEMNLDGRRFAFGQQVTLDLQSEEDIKNDVTLDGYDKEGMFIVTRILR